MNCDDVQLQLDARLDGELAARAAAEVDAHVSAVPTARRSTNGGSRCARRSRESCPGSRRPTPCARN
jgi:hypothetical protein